MGRGGGGDWVDDPVLFAKVKEEELEALATRRSLFDIPHVSSLVYHLFTTIEKKALHRVSSS